jgi:hypothetical protein
LVGDLALQKELFAEVLDELETDSGLTNEILEVTLEDDESGSRIVPWPFLRRSATEADPLLHFSSN